MKKTWTGVGGLGVGAALMYLFDPERGNRRPTIPTTLMLATTPVGGVPGRDTFVELMRFDGQSVSGG